MLTLDVNVLTCIPPPLGCPVKLLSSSGGDSGIQVNGAPPHLAPSRGLMLATMNISDPLEPCQISGSQTFDIHASTAAATGATDYMTAVPEGTWLLGVSRGSISAYLHLMKDFFLDELGIDTWELTHTWSRIVFAVVKGDKTTLKVHSIHYAYHVFLVADLTERKDGKLKSLHRMTSYIYIENH